MDKEALKKAMPKIDTAKIRKNIRRVIELQTNDELIESIQRLEIENEVMDEYERTFVFSGPSVQELFSWFPERMRGIVMTMLYVLIRNSEACVSMCGMGKRTLRLKDWNHDKFKFHEDGRHIASMVYDVRMKKGF